jgi:hypothetical protein
MWMRFISEANDYTVFKVVAKQMLERDVKQVKATVRFLDKQFTKRI